MAESVKAYCQKVIEVINSIHHLNNSTYAYHYSERGLFNNEEILDILHEMGTFSLQRDTQLSLVSSDHMINKLPYVASLALGGRGGCQKLFKHSIDLFSREELHDTSRLPILHPACPENINYYSNLGRKHLVLYLPIIGIY